MNEEQLNALREQAARAKRLPFSLEALKICLDAIPDLCNAFSAKDKRIAELEQEVERLQGDVLGKVAEEAFKRFCKIANLEEEKGEPAGT